MARLLLLAALLLGQAHNALSISNFLKGAAGMRPTPGGRGNAELLEKVQAFIDASFGADDPSLLADDAVLIRPNGRCFNGKAAVLSELANYKTAKRGFSDFQLRSHDLRVDPEAPNKVFFTTRAIGTQTGTFKVAKETIVASGLRYEAPPECFSVTFDDAATKAVRITAGFVMDRKVGTTLGFGMEEGMAACVGVPPAPLACKPVPQVLGEALGRPQGPLRYSPPSASPFSESVMFSLARAFLAGDEGCADADFLASDFKYYGPAEGPLTKKQYLAKFKDRARALRSAMPDLDPVRCAAEWRVDPFDPARVWATLRLRGTHSGADLDLGGAIGTIKSAGKAYEGAPEAYSFSFNERGECFRFTKGACMDPGVGNTLGLAGDLGIAAALGKPAPDLLSRSAPEAFQRLLGNRAEDAGKAPKAAPKAPAAPAAKAAPAPKPQPKAAPKPPAKAAPKPPAKAAPKPQAKAAPKPQPKAAPKPQAKAAPAKPAPKPAPKPAAKKAPPAPKPKAKAAPKPPAKKAAPKPPAKGAAPAPKAAPPTFSLFGSPAKKAEPAATKGAPAKGAAPAAKAAAPAFSLFGSPAKKAEPAAAKGGPAKKGAPAKGAPAKGKDGAAGAAKPTGLFSFGGGGGGGKDAKGAPAKGAAKGKAPPKKRK